MADTKIIYIADDDDNIRQVIRTFLLSDGFAVEDFPTGDLLLARFREKPAELVILDVMMPGSDGRAIPRTTLPWASASAATIILRSPSRPWRF